MAKKRKPQGYWTKERCKEESSKYKTKNELKEHSRGCYNMIYKQGWEEYVYPHMKSSHSINEKPPGYWTKERCKEEALKYNSKSNFRKGSRGCI